MATITLKNILELPYKRLKQDGS